jgi:myosin heavy subunit
VQARAGEVAIVRSKLEQAAREHERKIASMHQAYAEEIQKKVSKIEDLEAECERHSTEKAFLQKETDELARKERARREANTQVQVPRSQDVVMGGTVEVEASRGRQVTPKRKSKVFAFRDGFDDDDINMGFHSSAPKSRTPTRASLKRKRSVNGSPLPQLALTPSRTSSMTIDRTLTIDDKMLEKLFEQDDRFEVWFYATG